MGTVAVNFIGQVHDSLLFEYTPSNPTPVSEPENFRKPHHWIEDGDFEDFRRCIMESDLPWLYEISNGSGMWSLCGTVTGRLAARDVALMGTVTDPAYWGQPNRNGDAFVIQNFATIEQRVIEMLLNRPEVRAHESKAKALVAQAP